MRLWGLATQNYLKEESLNKAWREHQHSTSPAWRVPNIWDPHRGPGFQAHSHAFPHASSLKSAASGPAAWKWHSGSTFSPFNPCTHPSFTPQWPHSIRPRGCLEKPLSQLCDSSLTCDRLRKEAKRRPWQKMRMVWLGLLPLQTYNVGSISSTSKKEESERSLPCVFFIIYGTK